MHRTLALSLSLACIGLALLVFAISVSGVFWDATSPTDIGMLSTAGVFLLFGLLGLLLLRVQPAPPN